MPPTQSSTRITITTASLVRILLMLLALYFAYVIKDILILLLTAVILTSALDPWVDWLHKRAIPRALGILIIYIVIIGIFSLSVYLVIPPIVEQFRQLANDLPVYIEQINRYLSSIRDYTSGYQWLDNLKDSISGSVGSFPSASGNIFSTIFGIFGGVLSVIILLVITFYMLAEENSIRRLVWSVTPTAKQTYVMDVLTRMQKRIGLWLRGQLLLCLVIFALTYVGLRLLGIKYALVLALVAGVTEFIPYFGPILGAVPAVFLAAGQSQTLALLTVALYFVIQQLENNLLVPKVMQKTAGLNPIVSIVVLMIGFAVAGVLGALLAIPVTTAGMVVVEDMLSRKQNGKDKAEKE